MKNKAGRERRVQAREADSKTEETEKSSRRRMRAWPLRSRVTGRVTGPGTRVGAGAALAPGVCGGSLLCPGLTVPQPLQLCLELPLLAGQRRQMAQAGLLQPLQTLAEPGLSLFGRLLLRVPALVQLGPDGAAAHPRGQTVTQASPRHPDGRDLSPELV